VCAEWTRSFAACATWALANGYDLRLLLDRRNGNYTPRTYRLATRSEQAINRRRRRKKR